MKGDRSRNLGMCLDFRYAEWHQPNPSLHALMVNRDYKFMLVEPWPSKRSMLSGEAMTIGFCRDVHESYGSYFSSLRPKAKLVKE
ncbi:unnamed protein product [Prunus armeniaca]